MGILIKGGEVLERSKRIDTVVFDKTGTLTLGRMSLTDVVAAPGTDAEDLLRRAAATEAGSEHPVGRAVVDGATQWLGAVPAASGFRSSAGSGVWASVGTTEVIVGRRGWMADGGVSISGDLEETATRLEGGARPRSSWDGTARPGGCWRWPTWSAPTPPRRWPSSVASASL